ncbi:Fe-S cluster assembly protein SufD [Alteromonas gilva]|uniref:Fe-S cluster assembly protein SufD n=1 Tax=Alteromonas gilva TaxID=2987522 RepID=A0ABT5L839_9ALTE|nr:Fe-S cluster assembly protein SufD [Alteromonas gilva]MDC8832691.1 Fe-S cluster assembly protein SufD [Alteromonas gilva]
MSHWLSEVIAAGQTRQDWLAPQRQLALAELDKVRWPVRRQEDWRFTPLVPVEKRSVAMSTPSDTSVAGPRIDDLTAIELVFSGNTLLTDITALSLPDGVEIVTFATANAAQQEIIKTQFNKVKPTKHLFGQVNDALLADGVFITFAAGHSVTTPVRITQLANNQGDQHMRVLVHVQEGARATLFEDGHGSTNSFNTAFSEFVIDDNAYLEHYRLAMYTGEAMHVGGCHFRLGQKSELNSTLVGYGSQLSRLDVDVEYAGEFANAKLNAMYLLAEGELFDLHTTIEHAVPNCTTEENARGIVGDRAKAVFNGRIHIHRDAQKTLAELNNRNLLLSRRAIINTKPELEIYADDVKCAHGATVAEIDDTALYYLLARGIKRSQALIMLNFGFIQELIRQMPNQSISAWLLAQLHDRFVGMEVK